MISKHSYNNHRLFQVFALIALAMWCVPSIYATNDCSTASFRVASSLNLKASPDGLVVADFNGDGHLDMATTGDNSNEVIVFRTYAELTV